MRRFAAAVPFALLATLVVPAYAGSITIEGRGEVMAAPDVAQINSGVTTQGADFDAGSDFRVNEGIAYNSGSAADVKAAAMAACVAWVRSADASRTS